MEGDEITQRTHKIIKNDLNEEEQPI